MKIVMASGCFDIIHPGHIYYLTEAKKYGDFLVVVVARDVNILKFKGKKPVHSEKQRFEKIKSLNIADRVILGHHGEIFEIIKDINPNVICLGYDQTPTINEINAKLKEMNIKTEVVRITAFKPEIYKSSKFKNRDYK